MAYQCYHGFLRAVQEGNIQWESRTYPYPGTPITQRFSHSQYLLLCNCTRGKKPIYFEQRMSVCQVNTRHLMFLRGYNVNHTPFILFLGIIYPWRFFFPPNLFTVLHLEQHNYFFGLQVHVITTPTSPCMCSVVVPKVAAMLPSMIYGDLTSTARSGSALWPQVKSTAASKKSRNRHLVLLTL